MRLSEPNKILRPGFPKACNSYSNGSTRSRISGAFTVILAVRLDISPVLHLSLSLTLPMSSGLGTVAQTAELLTPQPDLQWQRPLLQSPLKVRSLRRHPEHGTEHARCDAYRSEGVYEELCSLLS